MEFTSRAKAIRDTGLTYLGGVGTSSKIVKSLKKNVDTYVLYLSPYKNSGYNVCPKASEGCISACLNESGYNRMDIKGIIDRSRIKKTKLFFEEREYFMSWLVSEIRANKVLSEKKGHDFSVRLNGTSDLSLSTFNVGGDNILDIFKDIQFYDYTKVLNRVNLVKRHCNYDLTFSYSGENWLECEIALLEGVRIAVVFEKVPKYYMGIPVIDGDLTDLRYMDEKNVIVGLKHKKTRKKIDYSKQNFIIPINDMNCEY